LQINSSSIISSSLTRQLNFKNNSCELSERLTITSFQSIFVVIVSRPKFASSDSKNARHRLIFMLIYAIVPTIWLIGSFGEKGNFEITHHIVRIVFCLLDLLSEKF
jgi:bacteriorhodopsin